MEHEYTFDELSKKTIAELREIAAKLNHPEVQGFTQLHKAELLTKLCAVFKIDMHHHHVAKSINKTTVKGQIRKLKAARDEALQAKDSAKLQAVREEIHSLKRKLRRAAV